MIVSLSTGGWGVTKAVPSSYLSTYLFSVVSEREIPCEGPDCGVGQMYYRYSAGEGPCAGQLGSFNSAPAIRDGTVRRPAEG